MLENRRYVILSIFVLMGLVFLIKLFALQVTDESYKFRAERNTRTRIIEYPFRGLIFDRNQKLLVYNEPIYDLMMVPGNVYIADTARFCKMLNISPETFKENMKLPPGHSLARPIPFIRKISHEEYARIQDDMYNYGGFYINPRTVRKYASPILANELGYIGEISQSQLNRDSTGYYRSGDHIGLTGLERFYENELRGERGVSYKLVNVRGIQKGAYLDGTLDTLPQPGKNLITTLDKEVQEYAEWLMEGKRGSIVAIEPSTGEILTMVTAPSYDPNLMSGREFGNNFKMIAADTNKRLFNRAIQAVYPPGSIFKTVQALIALDEGVIRVGEKLKPRKKHLGGHAAIKPYDVPEGIRVSSNNYFYEVMEKVVQRGVEKNIFRDSRIGLAKWADAAKKYGFGSPLGLDMAGEEGGLVPDENYYDRLYKKYAWAFSTIYSLSIGQGELLVTPLQVANLGAIIANRGYYIKPHLVKGFEQNGKTEFLTFAKIATGNSTEYYPAIIEGMARAAGYTANMAKIRGIEIAGKTGTAENGIKGETIDHSVFMAFAPRENPKIAISVYVENAGWGGGAAAVTAALVMEKYLKREIDHRGWLDREAYIKESRYLNNLKKEHP